LGSGELKPSRKDKEGVKAQLSNLRVRVRRRASQVSKRANGQKSPPPAPRPLFIGEEEAVVYIYSIGGVEYYKKVPEIYKQVPRCCN